MSDLFSREIQVLPQRTHPRMTMDSASGFVAWGITLVSAHTIALPSLAEVVAHRAAVVADPLAFRHPLPSTAPVALDPPPTEA
jgi:hypothetical protein